MKALSDFILRLLTGSRHVCRHSPGDGRPCPARHGMVDNTQRTARRPCCTNGGIRDDYLRADDGCIIGDHV